MSTVTAFVTKRVRGERSIEYGDSICDEESERRERASTVTAFVTKRVRGERASEYCDSICDEESDRRASQSRCVTCQL